MLLGLGSKQEEEEEQGKEQEGVEKTSGGVCHSFFSTLSVSKPSQQVGIGRTRGGKGEGWYGFRVSQKSY